jgi:hypothetical protein
MKRKMSVNCPVNMPFVDNKWPLISCEGAIIKKTDIMQVNIAVGLFFVEHVV